MTSPTDIADPVPIITIDGPAASGKGTVARLVRQKTLGLGNGCFHYLDSGAIYRVLAYIAQLTAVDWQDEAGLTSLAQRLKPPYNASSDQRFSLSASASLKKKHGDDFRALLHSSAPLHLHFAGAGEQVTLADYDMTSNIRDEPISQGASKVAVHPAVRQTLLELQRGFAQPPGLVTEGRDMGSVVFPKAQWQFYLDASPQVRAERRYKQLLAMGMATELALILDDIKTRDARDRARHVAPLQKPPAAYCIATDELEPEQVADQVMAYVSGKH